jgi:hypothetical protein
MIAPLHQLHIRSCPKIAQVDCTDGQRRSEDPSLKTLTNAKHNFELLSHSRILFDRKDMLSAVEPTAARNFRRFHAHTVRSNLPVRHSISHSLPVSWQPLVSLQHFRPKSSRIPRPSASTPADLRGGAIEHRTRNTRAKISVG